MEKWKPVKDYEGLYEVSDAGNVRSLDRTFETKSGYIRRAKGRVLKQMYVGGYCKVNLWKDGEMKMVAVHRLVATAFIDNTLNKPQVNHINGTKDDNRKENLEWNTNSENQKHAYGIGLSKRMSGELNHRSKVTTKEVVEIRELYNTGEYYQRELAEMYGVGRRHIGDIVNKEKWKHLS